MHETDSNGSGVQISSQTYAGKPRSGNWMRGLRLGAILLGVGLVLSAGVARAQDDEDEVDNKTFEEKLMDNLMSGLGAKSMDDKAIDYRERSPLVVPSKIELPPPQTGKAKLAPNWPKDPDVAERKAAIEAAKKENRNAPASYRPLMPSELATRTPRGSTRSSDNVTPGSNGSDKPIMMMPSDLGYTGGLFSNLLGGSKAETAPFVSEPERSELTQPPGGYQTPSPNFAYGTGGKQAAPIETCDSGSGKCEKRWQ